MRGKLFGIVDAAQEIGQAAQNPIHRKNDGGGHDRPGQRPAAGLVQAGDVRHALAQQFRFKTEIRRLGGSCRHGAYFRTKRPARATFFGADRGDGQGCSKVASKPLVMRKFSGFLPKAATTLERPWGDGCKTKFFVYHGRDGAPRRPGVAARRPYL